MFVRRISPALIWFVIGSAALGQTNQSESWRGRNLSGNPLIGPSVRVQSWPVDPFMSADSEKSILQTIHRPCPFAWQGELTLGEIYQDLQTRVPTGVNTLALEEIGLDLSFVVQRKSDLSKTNSRASMAAENSIVAENSKPSVYWWRLPMDSASHGSNVLSLGSRLLRLLGPHGLVVNVVGGQLVITSVDDAESNLVTRIYDVNRLTNDAASPSRLDVAARPVPQRIEHLIDLIQYSIAPDTWDVMGGPSTIGYFPSKSPRQLIISTTSQTHWQVQALLDGLIR